MQHKARPEQLKYRSQKNDNNFYHHYSHSFDHQYLHNNLHHKHPHIIVQPRIILQLY